MKVKQLIAIGTVTAATCGGLGLAAENSSASPLPQRSTAARDSMASATIDSPAASSQPRDDLLDAAVDFLVDQTENLADALAGAAPQAPLVPAPRGAQSADAQFNAG
jgi:hypothetical protein